MFEKFFRNRRRAAAKKKFIALRDAGDPAAFDVLRAHLDADKTDDTALATYIGFLKQAEIWGEDSAHSMVIRYPDNVAAWYERGQLMYRVGDWPIAEASYARVLELAAAAGDIAPGAVATAHFQRGVIADETGDAVAAVQHYDHALALERDDADAWLNRGNSLMQLRRFDDALASYERAARLEVSAAVDERRAMALVCLGRLSEANALLHPRDAVWAEEQVTEGRRTLTLRYLATTEFAAPLRNAARMVLQVAVDVANEWRDGYRLHVGGSTFTLRGDGDVFVVAEPDWQRHDVTRCVREYVVTSLRELLLGLSLADQLGYPPTDSFLDDEVEITTEWDGTDAWQMMRCAERQTAVERIVWQIAVPQKPTLPADARERVPLVSVLKRVPQLRSLTLVPLGFGVLVEAGAPAAILNRHGAEVRDLRDPRPN